MHTGDWYTIDMGAIGKGSLDVPCPKKLPEGGDILYFTDPFTIPSGQTYSRGDEIHLMRRTDEAPHGKRSSLGNWLAISKLGPSVWSNIEWMLVDKIVSRRRPRKRKSDPAR